MTFVAISSDAGLDLLEHGAFVQPGEAHHKAGSHLRGGRQKLDTLSMNNMGQSDIYDILSHMRHTECSLGSQITSAELAI